MTSAAADVPALEERDNEPDTSDIEPAIEEPRTRDMGTQYEPPIATKDVSCQANIMVKDTKAITHVKQRSGLVPSVVKYSVECRTEDLSLKDLVLDSRCLEDMLVKLTIFLVAKKGEATEEQSSFSVICCVLPRPMLKVVEQVYISQQLFHRTCIVSQKTAEEKQVAEQLKRNKEAGLLTELVRDFLDPAEFYQAIRRSGIDFFCGVPDSLLKDFCAYVTKNAPEGSHVITANEGNAVGLAAGYHLATGKHALVYLQNSGLGNIVNPVMSLAVPPVFSIPMLLLIGWRGEPGKRDEPQHKVQGQATPGLLAALGIPFQPLPDFEEGAEQALQTAKQYMETTKGPYAFLVKRQTFLPYKLARDNSAGYPMTREEAMHVLVNGLSNRDVIISSTGMLSRELFEYRVSKDMGHERDFLTVGSMGHTSSIALGVAMQKSKREVFCLDGDGAVIMHMGVMASIGQNAPVNFKHVIFNNGCHDSVGGQPTEARKEGFNFCKIAMACGYEEAFTVSEEEELRNGISKMKTMKGPVLMEIKISAGARKDLGRPTRTLLENKDDFMHFLAIN